MIKPIDADFQFYLLILLFIPIYITSTLILLISFALKAMFIPKSKLNLRDRYDLLHQKVLEFYQAIFLEYPNLHSKKQH